MHHLSPAVVLIAEMFAQGGSSLYGGEAVTQLEHALQAAWFAERAGSSPALMTAALLHDVGHLLHTLPDDAPEQGIDDQHEELAARWLMRFFPADVVEPVRLHVAAKRYLCATNPDYARQLSEPSVISLRLQGGPMSPEEVTEFERHPQFAAAIQLRRFDEAAKVPELQTPPLEHFLEYVERSRPR